MFRLGLVNASWLCLSYVWSHHLLCPKHPRAAGCYHPLTLVLRTLSGTSPIFTLLCSAVSRLLQIPTAPSVLLYLHNSPNTTETRLSGSLWVQIHLFTYHLECCSNLLQVIPAAVDTAVPSTVKDSWSACRYTWAYSSVGHIASPDMAHVFNHSICLL